LQRKRKGKWRKEKFGEKCGKRNQEMRRKQNEYPAQHVKH
jgi:hypothetical protein